MHKCTYVHSCYFMASALSIVSLLPIINWALASTFFEVRSDASFGSGLENFFWFKINKLGFAVRMLWYAFSEKY